MKDKNELRLFEVENGFRVVVVAPTGEEKEEYVFVALESLTAFIQERYKRKEIKGIKEPKAK